MHHGAFEFFTSLHRRPNRYGLATVCKNNFMEWQDRFSIEVCRVNVPRRVRRVPQDFVHGGPESYIPFKVELIGICFEVLLNLAPRGEIRIICEMLVRLFQHYGSFVHRRLGMGKSLKLDYTREVSLDEKS